MNTGEGDENTAEIRATHASQEDYLYTVGVQMAKNTCLRHINLKGNDSIALTGDQAIGVKTGVRRT